MDDKTKAEISPEIIDEKTTEMTAHDVEFSNDSDVDYAVDKIVNEESDELLKAGDEARERQFAPPQPTTRLARIKKKVKDLAVAWWDNKRVRYGTIAGVVLLFIFALFIPFTRYGMLNLAGVRVSSSMTILDSKTGLPLENIPVELQNNMARTNGDGYVSFDKLKQGSTLIKIDKRGYAPFENNVTLGWGSNRLDNQEITATGAQFTFVLKDWLSDEPLQDGEASSGEDVAKTNDDGRVILTVGDIEGNSEVVLSAEGYREERIKLNDITGESQDVKMVPVKQHVFVSNRNGKYDLYKIDVDGKNEEVLMAASGKEREVPFALPSQDRDITAYVSSRDGDINKDGFVLDGLFIVDVKDGETYKVTRSEQLQAIGWVGDKLIYVSVIEGVSAGNSQRSKITSYDVETKERKDLATSNYFNDVKLINDTVYYAVSSYAVPQSQAKLFSVDAKGENKQTVVNTQVWNIIRESYDKLVFNAIDLQWYEQILGGEATKLDAQPPSRSSRVYSSSPNGERSVWVDVRDGKGVLLMFNTDTKSEDVILTESGLSDPVYWLDDSYIVYRIETSQETADYILQVDSNKTQKIADVLGNRSRYFY